MTEQLPAPFDPDPGSRHPAASEAEFAALYTMVIAPARNAADAVLRDAAEAEDIAQEVGLRLHQAWLENPRAFATSAAAVQWARTTATRLALNEEKDRRRLALQREVGVARGAFDEAAVATPHDVATGREAEERIARLANGLAARQRTMFLHIYEGRSAAEIADQMQIKVQSVRNARAELFARLRAAMGPEARDWRPESSSWNPARPAADRLADESGDEE